VRGRLRWEPSDKLAINLIGDYTKSEDPRGFDFFVINKAIPSLQAELNQCGIGASDGNRDYCTNNPNPAESKNYGASAQIDYDFGPVAFTSVTSSRKTESSSGLDIFRLDVHPLRITAATAPTNTKLLTQEFRLASPSDSRVEYTVGVFFSKQEQDTGAANFRITASPFPGLVIPIVNNRGSIGATENESQAIFGQATFKITDQLNIIAGARYTHEVLENSSRSLDTGLTYSAKADIDNTSWKIGPQYKFNPDLMAYATVSRGYKGPQIAGPDTSVPGSRPTVIRPEIPTNYEAGLKATVLGGRVLTDLSAFYLDLKDYQGQLCTPQVAGGLRCVPQNIGQVISKGVEFNAFGQPMDGLNVTGGLIWNRVEYPDNFRGTDGTNIGGEQLVAAPEWKATFSAEYSHEVADGYEGFISGDAVYKSEIRYLATTDPNGFFDAHWLLGGRIGIRNTEHGWSASIFGRNLTDEHEPVARFQNFPDGSIGSYGQILNPQSFRLVGVSLDAKF
jgi:iron complex outermembrane receptor protein